MELATIPWSLGSFAYALVKDLLSWFWRRRRRLTPAEVVQLRAKWKGEFEQKTWERQQKGLGRDVIIRDVRRVDSYPQVNDKESGISPWFRVGLVDTYHRGILALLRWGTLARTATNELRYTSHKDGERGDMKVCLVGYIPYENIEHVDWDGDEYYYQPVIYCHFDARAGEPYEELAFCEKRMLDDHEYYTKIAALDEVHKASARVGVEYFS